jgi:hypothetical protein
MAVIKGYADDSRPGDKIWVVSGYVGGDHKWEAFDEKWPKLLVRHGIPYFHMKEIGNPKGVYAKWHPLKEHQEEMAAFFRDMTALIKECWFSGFWSIVRIDALEKFNAETGLNLKPYSLAAYGCLLMVASEFGDLTCEIFFDHVEKVHSKLGLAMSYAESDRFLGEALGNVALMPLPRNITSREFGPLQIADFFTWEMQRNHLNADELHAQSGRPMDEDERWEHFQAWCRDKFGTDLPAPRKSLAALIEGGNPVSGILWDYDQLCRANELRGGVWA